MSPISTNYMRVRISWVTAWLQLISSLCSICELTVAGKTSAPNKERWDQGWARQLGLSQL